MAGTDEAPRPTAGASPKGPAWIRRYWKVVTIAVVALLVGTAIGANGITSKVNKKNDQLNAEAAQIADLTTKNAGLQKQVDDRAAKTAADNAHAAAVKADEQAAKDKAAAAARAKVAAAAAAAKARADAAAAAAKAQADAAAKAQADAAAAAAAQAAKMNTIDGDGVYAIGTDVNPGEWRTSGGSGCYYAVLNSPDTNDIATNNITDGPAIVDLPPGKYFDTSNCGTWTHS